MKLAFGIVLAAVAVAAVTAGDPATLSTKEEATKTTKATKSEKTGTASGSGIGSLFEDGSDGTIGSDSAADATVDPKMLTRIGITVPISKDGSGGLNLGPGPAVYPSDSGSWDWSWDSVEGSGSSTEASTAGSSKEACPDACTMEYSPVTDENGKTYSNECAMRLAKCKGETGEKKKIINFAVLDEPTVVKGTKEAETPATKTTKATKSEKTGTASGSGIGSLFADGSSGVIGSDSESGSADPTLVKGSKETPIPIQIIDVITKAPILEATKTTKATKSTKSEKTDTASGSGIGILFADGSSGVIGNSSESGSVDPTLVKGSKETPAPIEITKAPVLDATKTAKATKSTKSEKTGTASSSSIGSLFDDGSNGVIGSESGSADPTLVKATTPPAEKTVPASKTTKILP
ncbi:hypothetical protein V7S43_012347 [Phytophthora oleae]|uniref:Kazal-like domain-containing protein n=1 Tax=Phytophthora oleae TaxID=2107226 RepID=A0ABD3F6N0_9STRA